MAGSVAVVRVAFHFIVVGFYRVVSFKNLKIMMITQSLL